MIFRHSLLRIKPGITPLPRRSSGFTLVELLLVLAIMALLVAALPLVWGYTDSVQLRLAAENVANEVRLAQTLAQTEGRNTRLSFYNAARKVVISYDGDPARKELKEPLYLPAGIDFAMAADAELSFTSLGGVYYSGSIGSAAWTTSLIAPNGEKYFVIIAVNSGRVRISPSATRLTPEG